MSHIEDENLASLVRQVLGEVLVAQSSEQAKILAPFFEKKPEKSKAQENIARWLGYDPISKFSQVTQKAESFDKVKETSDRNLIPQAHKPEKLEAMLKTTPARVGVWRTGTRYLTEVALKLRADHAVAKDAVYSELEDDYAEKNGWLALKTQAKNREEFLLRPDLGRKLSEESLKIVNEKGLRDADVQITVSDGLSAWAAQRNAKPVVEELLKLCKNEGMKVGPVFCVKHARIAIQDVIGEMLGAKISLILLGERPGLGGGDSLSNYMAYAPKIGMVNAQKSMISNIHPNGHKPEEAAKLTFEMIKKMFEQKCSGVELKI